MWGTRTTTLQPRGASKLLETASHDHAIWNSGTAEFCLDQEEANWCKLCAIMRYSFNKYPWSIDIHSIGFDLILRKQPPWFWKPNLSALRVETQWRPSGDTNGWDRFGSSSEALPKACRLSRNLHPTCIQMDPHKTVQDYQKIQGCASRISRVTHDWKSQKLSEAFALLACMEGLVRCSR